ncbi:MAG TPA: PHB depolymerase family esterase [Burkholderiales bacterium]|nr:PHB depolymerase family esterase [Burkholderiales bacterium]
MAMNRGIPIGLIEATQLTRAGRLLEATALIQRILRQNSPSAEGADRHASDLDGRAHNEAIDVEFLESPSPANRGLIPLQKATGDDISQRSELSSFVRGWRDRDSVAAVPRPQTTVVDGQQGQFVIGSYSNQAGTRPYKLYIPTSYAGQPLPIVVMLHGCAQTPDDFANGTRMNALAEERQCLVLYPEQTRAANHSRCWNWFKRGDQRRGQGEPAILAGMTHEVMNRYRIDPGKVYVAGLSAGGAMAAVMSTLYPELYAAVGIHSGLACGSAHDLPSAFAAMRGIPASMAGRNTDSTPLRPVVPSIVFHGDRDKTVHPRNSEQVISQSVEQHGASSADASTERGQVPGGHAYTRTVHRDSTGRVVLEHWLVHGGGHAWFGGSPRGSYVDPKGPDAAREMIRFFYQNTIEQRS